MTRRAAPANLPFEPRGLSREEAAAYVGVGTTHFDKMVSEGRMPKPFRLDGRVIFDRKALDRRLDALSDQQADDPYAQVVA